MMFVDYDRRASAAFRGVRRRLAGWIAALAWLVAVAAATQGRADETPHPGTDAAAPRHAWVNYLGWMSSSFLSQNLQRATDFPVTPLDPAADNLARAATRYEIGLMHEHGWSGVLVDFLFFDDKRVERQINLTASFLQSVEAMGLEGFGVAPFLELKHLKSPAVFVDGLTRLLQLHGSHPNWLRVNDRPVVFLYGSYGIEPGDWPDAMARVRQQSGYDPFYITTVGGVEAALFGRIDRDSEWAADLFDGAFSFSASSLQVGANVPAAIRETFAGRRFAGFVGGSVWPGYLSDRPKQRNFNSHRGTAFLRSVWETTLNHQPDFIHFTTWNDFHEATTLVPSYSTLTSRLEISQVYLDRYFDRPSTVEPVDRPRAVLSYRKAIYPGEPLSFELLPLPSPGMPERGRWTIEIVDDHGRLVAQETSGSVSMDAMTPWVWEPEVAVDRGRTRALRVRASVELADGRIADYRHLPDVAIVPPVSVVDSLFYHVPLHRLSQAEDPPLRLLVNGQGPGVEPARHEGVRQVSIESSIDDLPVAMMRNGLRLRLLAPVNAVGARALLPDEGDRPVQLRRRTDDGPLRVMDWRPSASSIGEDYYAAVARLPDGSWAYTPTVWSAPSVDRDAATALWLGAPTADALNTPSLVDRSGHGHDLIASNDQPIPYERLDNDARAVRFDGRLALKCDANGFPTGPISVEAVFSLDAVREQVVIDQDRSQAQFKIASDGRLIVGRMPELRDASDPLREAASREALEPGRVYHAVATYDGRRLALYLDGQLQEAIECRGTRPIVKWSVGGSANGTPAGDGFTGRVYRVAVYSGALAADAVRAMHERAAAIWP